jgi:hypothetical protein
LSPTGVIFFLELSMLRLVILKDILKKPRLASQYTSHRLMSATKNEQPEEPVAKKTPLALPATADSDSVPSAELNSSFKLSEMGPVGKVSLVSSNCILLSLHLTHTNQLQLSTKMEPCLVLTTGTK